MVDEVGNFLNKYHFFMKYKKIILYFIFGSIASLFDLGVFFVLFNFFGISSVFSTIISISCATVVGFILNAIANFQVKDKFFLRFFSYSVVSAVGAVISSGMLYFFHEVKHLDGNIIKLISLPVIFVVQYLLNSKISFYKKENK